MKVKKVTMPMLGAAYYPEAWDESEQEHDIAYMKKVGINVVRMAEFAWAKIEPKQGEFHFEWLHQVIGKLEEAGIAVILGTPSATPPVWLEKLDPSMMVLYESDCRAQHGTRRENCSNNPTYRRYVARVVEKMAVEFGADPRIVGWQIDNEIVPPAHGCFCDECRKKFTEHLRKKYGTIENLNQRWNLNLWSQIYDDFEQIPMPKSYTWHNPHLLYEWKEFNSDSCIDFVKMQIDILRRYTKAPIGTDMMPTYALNYEKIATLVDVMQFNQYFDEQNMARSAFWYDYIRTFKKMPFWLMETSTCWNGSVETPASLRPEGFCRANSWLPIILGGGASLYWLWRQHRMGHELMHGSVLYASGRPLHIFDEVQEISSGFNKASNWLSNTRVKTDTAMVISTKSNLLFEVQPIAPRIQDEAALGSFGLYQYMTEYGIRPDLIAPTKDFSNYKLMFTPYLMTLEEGNLEKRIVQWVKDGGVWVVGPMTDIRNDIGAHYTDRETGILEEFTGCQLVQQVPDAEHRITCSWKDGSEYKACRWLQLFDLCEEAESLVDVTEGFSTLLGKSVVFKKKIGKGTVIVVGGHPKADDARRILDIALSESKADVIRMEGKIVAARRAGEGFCGIAAQEIGGKTGTLYINGSMTDLLTGSVHSNEVELVPYQTVILQTNLS